MSLHGCGELPCDGERVDACFCELQSETLGYLNTWEEELTQLSGKRFEYFLLHQVQRCASLALATLLSSLLDQLRGVCAPVCPPICTADRVCWRGWVKT